ncbi:MAG TPA: hypothetical protein VNT60_09035 [Deinococcales bacterium]|nr:hypothetical protein [Deinococcales bacterium]
MRYPAYESRDLTGTALLRDAEMMVKWKAAAEREGIMARTIQGVNYSIVLDGALAAEIATLYGPSLTTYEYDDAENTVRVLSQPTADDGLSSLEQPRTRSAPTGSDRDNGGNT